MPTLKTLILVLLISICQLKNMAQKRNVKNSAKHTFSAWPAPPGNSSPNNTSDDSLMTSNELISFFDKQRSSNFYTVNFPDSQFRNISIDSLFPFIEKTAVQFNQQQYFPAYEHDSIPQDRRVIHEYLKIYNYYQNPNDPKSVTAINTIWPLINSLPCSYAKVFLYAHCAQIGILEKQSDTLQKRVFKYYEIADSLVRCIGDLYERSCAYLFIADIASHYLIEPGAIYFYFCELERSETRLVSFGQAFLRKKRLVGICPGLFISFLVLRWQVSPACA